jgi:hypothetical protein
MFIVPTKSKAFQSFSGSKKWWPFAVSPLKNLLTISRLVVVGFRSPTNECGIPGNGIDMLTSIDHTEALAVDIVQEFLFVM